MKDLTSKKKPYVKPEVILQVPMETRTGTSNPSGSSIRFKENIETVHIDIDKYLDLKVVNFDYKGRKEVHPQVGLIGEDVEKLMPEMVIYKQDDIAGEIVDGVKYDRIPLYNLEMIKRQQAMIQSIQERIQYLTEENEKLKQAINIRELESILV
jgi:hypothetical protein